MRIDVVKDTGHSATITWNPKTEDARGFLTYAIESGRLERALAAPATQDTMELPDAAGAPWPSTSPRTPRSRPAPPTASPGPSATGSAPARSWRNGLTHATIDRGALFLWLVLWATPCMVVNRNGNPQADWPAGSSGGHALPRLAVASEVCPMRRASR